MWCAPLSYRSYVLKKLGYSTASSSAKSNSGQQTSDKESQQPLPKPSTTEEHDSLPLSSIDKEVDPAVRMGGNCLSAYSHDERDLSQKIAHGSGETTVWWRTFCIVCDIKSGTRHKEYSTRSFMPGIGLLQNSTGKLSLQWTFTTRKRTFLSLDYLASQTSKMFVDHIALQRDFCVRRDYAALWQRESHPKRSILSHKGALIKRATRDTLIVAI